jgi:hypothetical protein
MRWSRDSFNVPSINRDLVKHILNNKSDMGYWISSIVYNSSGENTHTAHPNQFKITIHDGNLTLSSRYLKSEDISLADPDLIEKARTYLRELRLDIHDE